jgi:protein transport protein SEC61 subunit alpha
MSSKFLQFFSPFVRITPEIKQPEREISFRDKMIYTIVILMLYIIMSQIPLYGIDTEQGVDYYYWLRVILASNRGTLTEMGIGPIVTAGLVMQLLQGSKIINVNMADPTDRALFTGAQKVISILLAIFQIIAYTAGGAFGDIDMGAKILVFVQLYLSTLAIMMMDEILQKGYGLGSGISLFIATGVAGQIFWNSFSYIENPSGGVSDGLPQGIVIAFFNVLFGRGGTFPDTHPLYSGDIKIRHLWIRTGGNPGLLGFFTTIIIFAGVIWVQSVRVEIPLTYSGYKGYRGKYPMKLLYVSNIPVILAQALYANFLFFGQLFWNWGKDRANWSFWVNLIGKFKEAEGGGGGHLQPESGLIYYLTPPQGLSSLITQLATDEATAGKLIVHSVLYLAFFIFICVLFGQIWVEVSGLAPRDIAQQILDSQMQIPGFRRSEKIIEKILKRYIPTLTVLCGIIVGLLSFTADFLGSLSSGTGLLLTVGIVQNYAETIAQEAAKESMPGMANFLGS